MKLQDYKSRLNQMLIMFENLTNQDYGTDVKQYYIERLSILDHTIVLSFLKEQLEDAKRLPSIREIKKACGIVPELTVEEKMGDVADRIAGCLSSCGYNNPDKAKELIGEVGWVLVQRLGGWRVVCESVPDFQNLAIHKAQWKKSLIGIHNQALRGDNSPPSLPKARSMGLQSAQDVLNSYLQK